MNLDELRSVQTEERHRDSLQQLPDSFYEDVAAYIRERTAERERAAERAEDPFASTEVRRLTDEIDTAREVAKAIYERRMGKIVKQASLAAAGMSSDAEGLTSEERALYEDLVDRIERNKSRVLEVLDGQPTAAPSPGDDRAADSPAPAADDAGLDPAGTADPTPTAGTEDRHATDPEPTDSATRAGVETDPDGVSAADVMGGTEGSDSPAADERDAGDGHGREDGRGSSVGPSGDDGDRSLDGDEPTLSDVRERVTVQLTRDVGSILGVDEREYHLAADEVVTLPAENAEPLVERGAAKRLE